VGKETPSGSVEDGPAPKWMVVPPLFGTWRVGVARVTVELVVVDDDGLLVALLGAETGTGVEAEF
jgi:hypothetical protein